MLNEFLSIVYKFILVGVISLLIGITSSLKADNIYNPNFYKYRDYDLDVIFKLAAAKAELKSKQKDKEVYYKLYQMEYNCYQEQAASKIAMDEAKLKYDVASKEILKYEKKVQTYNALNTILQLRMKIEANESSNIEKVKQIYDKVLVLKCQILADDIDISKIKFDFSKKWALIFKAMLENHSGNLKDFLLMESRMVESKAHYEEYKKIYEDCIPILNKRADF